MNAWNKPVGEIAAKRIVTGAVRGAREGAYRTFEFIAKIAKRQRGQRREKKESGFFSRDKGYQPVRQLRRERAGW
jgi:hypothetical protein